jgi:TolA-binding protein
MDNNRNDFLDELNNFKKELINTRNLTIKTDNLLQNIYTEVKTIQKSLNKFEKKSFSGSILTYIIFAIFIFITSYLIFGINKHENPVTGNKDNSEIKKLRQEIETLNKEFELTKEENNKFVRAYYLIKENKPDEANKLYDELEKIKTNTEIKQILKTELENLKKQPEEKEIDINSVYINAQQKYKNNNFDSAKILLNKIIKFSFENKPTSLYYLADIEYKQRNFKEAIKWYNALIKEYPNSIYIEIANYLIGICYEKINDKETAKTHYKNFLENYPKSKYSNQVKTRLRLIDG